VAQAVTCRPVTMESRVLARVTLCGICGGHSSSGTGFSSSSLVFHCQYHSTMAVHTYISSGG
jgi:hypothetical protein